MRILRLIHSKKLKISSFLAEFFKGVGRKRCIGSHFPTFCPNIYFFSESDNLTVARELREGVFVLRDSNFCKQTWAKPDTRKKICAGELGRGTARGDSGGPLMKNSDDGKWYQIGITSYGNRQKKFNRRDYPGISTRISWYCPWIEKVTKNEVKCIKYERDKSSLNIEEIEKIFKVNLTEEAQYKFPNNNFAESLWKIPWFLIIFAGIMKLLKS